MPNSIGTSGLQTAGATELRTFYEEQFREIYGDDIDLSPDTPDGQIIGILVQAAIDLLDLVTQVYNGFDPDNAIGVTLDQRVAINGIQRQAGTHTVTNVTVVTDRALNLPGLDQTTEQPYTVADNAGTQWQLINSQTISGAGTYVYAFQAANPGATLTVPNTITTPVSIIIGITSLNNPTTYSSLGVNEELDAQLKIRRQKSVSLSTQGFLSGLLAALQNIEGVTGAFVYENNSSDTDINGIPGHSIWVIVAGSAEASAIANAIYTKRNAGAGMFGSISYLITQLDGSQFPVFWDTVVAEDLYIKFTVSSLDGITPPNIAAIREGLVTSFAPGVSEKVNVNDLATKVQEIDDNALVTSAGFSTDDGGPFTVTLSPSTLNKQFAVSEPNIIILPIILSPAIVTVGAGTSKQFTPLGGFGTMTYTMFTNASGGSVDSNGLYTAGPTPGVDVVRVTDQLGNTGDATVTVV